MSKIKIGNVKGQDGFSPTVKENPNNTDDNYRLDVTDKNGTFTTPNLKADSNYIAETYATKTQVNGVENQITTNLLKPTLATTTKNGVTCTNNGDGTYTLNGTATADTMFFVGTIWNMTDTELRMCGCPSGGSANTYHLIAFGALKETGSGITYGSWVEESPINICVMSGVSVSNLVFKPMVTTNLDADYSMFVSYTGSTGQINSDVAEIIDKKADKEKYGDTIVSVGRKPDSTVGENSFAFGEDVTASGQYSHAEGTRTTADGNNCHAEGAYTTANVYASHAEGYGTTAGSAYSHAEGNETTASEQASHAEGEGTTASGQASHAEGANTTANTLCAHAEGYGTTADGNNCHAEGYGTTASQYCSHAEGYYTTSLCNQHAQGHYNNTTTATYNSTSGTSTGTAFVIGNGTESSPSNAYRVTGEGVIYATNAAVQTGADYAEYFEWSDGNPDKEDRVGLFVTFDESEPEKIRIANSNDDYILGIVSGMPSVIGNGDEDWKKRYVLDDFGRYIQETFEYVENEETKTGTKWKENPEYDNTKPYAPRAERAEWSAIGLVGVLSVYDDGTCQVNGYCKCKDNGIATAVEKGADTYRVIKRVNDNIVKVVLK